MKELKEIAGLLSKGEVLSASKLRAKTKFADEAHELEVTEIARQAIVTFLKKGEIDNARKVCELFALSSDATDEAVKQAVLSALFDGNMACALEIKKKLPMPAGLCEQVVEYYISWGKADQAVMVRANICAA